MLGTLKINIGYDKLLVYDVSGRPIIYQPNGTYIDMFNDDDNSSYNRNTVNDIESTFSIKFPYTLEQYNKVELQNKLNTFYSYLFPFSPDYGTFNPGIIEDFIASNEQFIYPIILADNNIFNRNETIEIPQNLAEYIRLGNAKLVFCYLLEGHFGSIDSHYVWLSNLSKKYGFKKENILILTGNMLANEIHQQLVSSNIVEDNFTIYPFAWFGHHIFFHEGGWKLNTDVKTSAYESFFNSLNENRTLKKELPFLSFNRLAKVHRACIFAELRTNPLFKDKYIVSFGNIQTLKAQETITFVEMISRDIREDYKYGKERLIEFFKTHDQDSHFTYDCSDFENNKAEVLNKEAHSRTFVNIVNESLTNERSIFFSEKTFKPIFMCQPFILFGNPYSLKKLREMGNRTFDKWWDESYDLETDFTRRLEKIVSIMIEIASWDLDKLYEITNEMEEVLFHNFNIMMNDSDVLDLYKVLDMGDRKLKNTKLI